MSLGPRRVVRGDGSNSFRGAGEPSQPRDEDFFVTQLLENLRRLEKEVETKENTLASFDEKWRRTQREEADLKDQLRELSEQLAEEELEGARSKLEIVQLRNKYEEGTCHKKKPRHFLLPAEPSLAKL